MQITGSHSINQPASELWKYLNNSEVLARITPGLKELEMIEEDKFNAISEIKIGPVKAKFQGELEMQDKVDGKSMVVAIKQNSKIGNVTAAIGMKLEENEGITEVNYEGEAKMAGKLATMGQRIVGSVVSSLSKQFFVNLENEFKTN